MTQKIVINRGWGPFALSEKAKTFMGLVTVIRHRSDPKLVDCVETLKDEANGEGVVLKIVEIPDDIEWEIGVNPTHGMEWIREKHRTWW